MWALKGTAEKQGRESAIEISLLREKINENLSEVFRKYIEKKNISKQNWEEKSNLIILSKKTKDKRNERS